MRPRLKLCIPVRRRGLLNQNWSWRNAPYVVAQNTGSFSRLQICSTSSTPCVSREDADAYLARLWPTPANRGETGRLKAAASQGVNRPDFLLDKTLAQSASRRGGNVAGWPPLTSIIKRTQEIAEHFGARAAKIAGTRSRRRSTRSIAELETHRRRAAGDAACGNSRRGDAYYAWTLRAATTTQMRRKQIHDPAGRTGRAPFRDGHHPEREGFTRAPGANA